MEHIIGGCFMAVLVVLLALAPKEVWGPRKGKPSFFSRL